MKKLTLLFLISNVLLATARAEQTFPLPDWKDEPNPLAGEEAQTGGKISVFASQYPKSLNYYLDNSAFCAQLFDLLYDPLLALHPLTLIHEPGVAHQWTLSDDKKKFTFRLNPEARWSDGRPITAEDLLWTYDTIMKPEHLTGVHKVSLERFEKPEMIDTHTVRFKARKAHWNNLPALASFRILPKHAFKKLDFNKINFEFPVVSGRYRIEKIREGVSLLLQRRDDWWNRSAKRVQGTGNFEQLDFRFYAQRDHAYEAFKKGEIDLFSVYTAHRWVQQTHSETFKKNWIIKQAVHNEHPPGFQGFAMNLRRDLFKDARVRKALAHLLNRERMNSTLMHNQYILHRSYYEDLYPPARPSPHPVIPFDKEKARALLREAGWRANPESGLLEKNGQPFTFKFLTRSATAEKFLVIYKEDLRDVGIALEIDKKDWAAWTRDMDEYHYDMTWAAWGGSLWKNPEGMWSSREAERTSGNNITGFKNARVDELIEKQVGVYDIEQRHDILREIDDILVSQMPYILLWNNRYTRLLYWNTFGTPDSVLSKYGDESSAYTYWWIDPDSENDLKHAMETREALPSQPKKIIFKPEKSS